MSSDSSISDESPLKQIAMLIVILLEPAQGGGMPEHHAKEIYEDVLGHIASLSPEAHTMLLDDVIFKWAVPILDKLESAE